MYRCLLCLKYIYDKTGKTIYLVASSSSCLRLQASGAGVFMGSPWCISKMRIRICDILLQISTRLTKLVHEDSNL